MSNFRPRRTFALQGRELSLAAHPGEVSEASAKLMEHARADNTISAYLGHIKRYNAWCASNERDAFSGPSVADFLAHCYRERRYARAALKQAVSALKFALARAGERIDWTAANLVLAGAVRTLAEEGRDGRGKATPLGLELVKRACAELYSIARAPRGVHVVTDDGGRKPEILAPSIAARDRALILIGYLGAFRRSDLVRQNVSDIRVVPQGLIIRMRGRKHHDEVSTRKLRRGKSPELCPVQAWEAWQKVRPVDMFDAPAWVRGADGRAGVHRLDGRRIGRNSVTRIVRRALCFAQVEAPELYSAHSFRGGLAVDLARAGVNIPDIAEAGGWENLETVLGYARDGVEWDESPLWRLDY